MFCKLGHTEIVWLGPGEEGKVKGEQEKDVDLSFYELACAQRGTSLLIFLIFREFFFIRNGYTFSRNAYFFFLALLYKG